MTTTRCILCPIDFSAFSRHALDSAVRLARLNRTRIIALHVLTRWPAVDVVPSLAASTGPKSPFEDEEREALLGHLRQFVGPYANEPVTIETQVVDAPEVHREIVARAEDLHAEVIVIGSHGRSGFQRLLLGSIAEKVLRTARCPVMVVPRHATDVGPLTSRPFARILCPVDFSCDAIGALSRATELACRSRGTVAVLHVIDIPAALFEMPGFEIAAYRHDAVAKIRKRLSEWVPESIAQGLAVVVAEGKPEQEILRVAAERDIDLIVMGVSGRRAVDLAVFGSTTHRVVRGASCPVLTIRREERTS